MSQTRYCSTCGSLLSEDAALCGECGARYRPSPYERRATDAPGSWTHAPRPRSRDRGPEGRPTEPVEQIELISRDFVDPRKQRTTAPSPAEQYDLMMVTQPPPTQNGPGAPVGQPSGPGSPGPSADAAIPATGTSAEMEPPLDGCRPASPVKRLAAAVIDGVIATVLLIPLIVAIVLLAIQDPITLFTQILSGFSVALLAAYTLLVVWLTGAKGFSFGKLIMGLRIARTSNGTGIGFLRAAGRWVLYGIIPWLMGLSIFLDPRSHLRGFHDRAVDSVVFDVKTGRNPFGKRADDYERADADHYLGDPSVAVGAHQNLLAEPGAAWTGGYQGTAAEAQPVGAGVDGPAASGDRSVPSSGASPVPLSGASPYAVNDWAPPREEPAGHQQWGPPAPAAPQPAQQWGSPAPQSSAAPSWDAPVEERTEALDEPIAASWGAPDGGIDEHTRLVPSEEPHEDLEQTRVTAVSPPARKKLRLIADDGTEHLVDTAAVIGRNPAAADGAGQLVLKDSTRSVSKTHLRIDDSGEDITVTDLGSTNGSAILHEDGSREALVPDAVTILPPGAQLTLGDRTLSVEREQ